MRLFYPLQTGIYIFALFCILFIPFPFNFFPLQSIYTQSLFESLIKTISQYLFGVVLINPAITSDSMSLYVLLLILLALSFLLSSGIHFSKKWLIYKNKVLALFRKLFTYYLALQLLKYGVDKVFKTQFYLPEPNILYTPLGQLDKDILYWSTMGTSHLYNVVTGSIEIVTALLLLVRKTRVVGVLLAVGTLINIIAINFGFDISVKVYSCILLLLALIIVSPQLKQLYQFLILQKPAVLLPEVSIDQYHNHLFIKRVLKIFIVCIIFLETVYPYWQAESLNDDLLPRTFLHGAYEVQKITMNSIGEISTVPIKRFFVHRNGYIIFQNQADQMTDFKLQIDTLSHLFVLTDYSLHQTKLNYEYNRYDSTMTLHYSFQNKPYILHAKALDWKKLPVLQDDFHWMMESN